MKPQPFVELGLESSFARPDGLNLQGSIVPVYVKVELIWKKLVAGAEGKSETLVEGQDGRGLVVDVAVDGGEEGGGKTMVESAWLPDGVLRR